jgi:hypothetical protein
MKKEQKEADFMTLLIDEIIDLIETSTCYSHNEKVRRINILVDLKKHLSRTKD